MTMDKLNIYVSCITNSSYTVDDKFKWTRKKRNKTCNFEFINMAYYFSIADSNKIDLHILKIYIKENRK